MAKLGPGASGRVKEGERVVNVAWAGTRVGNGTWQQYVVVPEEDLVGALRARSPLMSPLLRAKGGGTGRVAWQNCDRARATRGVRHGQAYESKASLVKMQRARAGRGLCLVCDQGAYR